MSDVNGIHFRPAFRRLSDTDFERRYRQTLAGCHSAESIQLDLRTSTWFDLWALIQFLLMLGSKQLSAKPRSIILLSPEALGPQCDETERNNAVARLRFLSDMEFLDRAAELDVTLLLQRTKSEHLTRVSPADIRQIAVPSTGEDDVDGRPIIPITSLASISSVLREKKDELFHRAEVIFARYFTEAIVQEAGIGDCLLSELLTNALEHGNTDLNPPIGYVALRAGLGLHGAKRRDPEGYKSRKFARTNHPLGDWRTYFTKYPDEPYFELLVVDRGKGISATIEQDERLPDRLKDKTLVPQLRQHSLIDYALEPTSSRFSPNLRRQKDRTEFTGLGAVAHVLENHDGFLLVREQAARHAFCRTTDKKLLCFTKVGEAKSKNECPLEHIPGTTVTTVIPMKGMHHRPLGFVPPASDTSENQSDAPDNDSIQPFRVRGPRDALDSSFLDKECGITWETIAERVEAGPHSTKIVLVDMVSASMSRNELWLGLSKTRKACQGRGIPLVLCGMDERSASRLEENASLDRKRISSGKDWILLGIGDDGRIYGIGHFGKNFDHKVLVAREAANMFAIGANGFSDALPLLEEANYIRNRPTTPYEGVTKSWDVSLPHLREALRSSQAEYLIAGIKQTSAWLPNTAVRLDNGDSVADYVCLHSVSQLHDMSNDFMRLLRLTASTVDYDFVLGVGPIAGPGARSLGQDLFRCVATAAPKAPLNNYAYHDYSSFDHGETSTRLIPPHSKVLILVDGIRSGDHAREVIRHVLDSGALPKMVISVFDLTSAGGPSNIEAVPIRYILELPIREGQCAQPWQFIESPFSHTLLPSPATSTHEWTIALSKRLAYKYAEGYGLLLQGHVTFYDQHFARTIPLPYLFSSSSSCLAEIVNNISNILLENQVDAILSPEHSSISTLVDRIVRVRATAQRPIETIVCRSATWPDQSAGYELDVLGKERLARAPRVLILDDETYTGSSVKALATLCFETLGVRLRFLAVYTVVDSMMRSERRVLTRLLSETSQKSADEVAHSNDLRPEIRLYAFMHFSLSPYWSKSSCPICQILNKLKQLAEARRGPIESGYASGRIIELTAKSMDQDLSARSRLHTLPEILDLERDTLAGTVVVSTREGLELFCEEAYVDGDIKWLVRRINPADPEFFRDPDVTLSIIELLSRDMRLLSRVGLRESFLRNLNAVLGTGALHGRHLALLMETLCNWPLYCLQEVWEALLKAVFAESNDDFVEAYGGAHLLLGEVSQRHEHRTRSLLLNTFDAKLLELFARATPSDRPRRTKAHLAMCLRRTSYHPPQHSRTVGEVIAELSFLLGFFAPDKVEHRILSRGLEDLLQCNALEEPRRFMYVVQIAEHVRADLSALVRIDPIASEHLTKAKDFATLLTAIAELQRRYPNARTTGTDSAELTQLQESAQKIHTLLYEDKSEGGLASILTQFLNEYRCTPRKALAPIIDWAKTDTGVHIVNSFSEMEMDSEDLLMVLNDEAIRVIFEELSSNLRRAKKRADESRRRSDLFEPSSPFKVSVQHNLTIETVIVSVSSPCTKGDFDALTSATGVGVRSLKTAVAWLGHHYEVSWDENSGTLQQQLSIRRIYR